MYYHVIIIIIIIGGSAAEASGGEAYRGAAVDLARAGQPGLRERRGGRQGQHARRLEVAQDHEQQLVVGRIDEDLPRAHARPDQRHPVRPSSVPSTDGLSQGGFGSSAGWASIAKEGGGGGCLW